MADRIVHHSAEPAEHVEEVCRENIELRNEVNALAETVFRLAEDFGRLSETLWAHFDNLAEEVEEIKEEEEEESEEGEPDESEEVEEIE